MTQLILPEQGFEQYLASVLPTETDNPLPATLIAAMRSGILPPGKLFRAKLMLRACAACGGVARDAFPLAAALELIHAYSLVHDDLECMDNADTRRGMPAVHRVYGEAMGVLAGDALLTDAFRIAATAPLPGDVAVRCIGELARLAGWDGMAGGQSADVESEQGGHALSFEELLEMYRMKTGALFVAAVKLGCMTAGAGDAVLQAAEDFGTALGIGYQIQDDILDVEGDPALLGKPVGADQKNQKRPVTFHRPMEQCRALLAQYRAAAREALQRIPNSALLEQLMEQALDRKS